MARILFMGTPRFAVPFLSVLLKHQHHTVVAVVTQPDAPSGRGRSLTEPPVKALAVSAGVPVLQPETLKSPEVVAQLRAFEPQVIVVAAFGQILRRDVLELPPRGCLNVHASLLPRWRGASPVSAAIAAGDAETGVTLMLMDPGLDTGPILSQRPEPIRAGDTAGSLSERLAQLGADLLVEVLPGWLEGAIAPRPQDESRATQCGQLRKEDGRIGWSRSAAEIERHVRAMSPWPAAWTTWQGKLVRVLRSAVVAEHSVGSPGAVSEDERTLRVHCGRGLLELVEVQPEGKRPMSGPDFARGQRRMAGASFGA